MTALGSGVRVKCIEGGLWEDGIGPATGSVWTIERVIRSGSVIFLRRAKDDYLILRGWDPSEIFRAVRFVPLDGNEDISALTGMLNKGPVDPVRKPETVARRQTAAA